eukprot:CAMPEP_0118858056 /NCGR_PEP_ID=MMETSP1163-20130328/4881_1 /TAXON_ID=124430 /ORGANISM="Phaeomonas parva, Strain CCMP2877" /LENGTH=240 /DNA_ID=CAMNT_0006791459 /DNA_START=342 /DNA_END=1065 /DNA_ORIENTATION=-
MLRLRLVLLLLLGASGAAALRLKLKLPEVARSALLGSALACGGLIHHPTAAVAFENHIEPVFKGPKTPGPEPKDLGVDGEGLLKACFKAAPNCFSSTQIDDPNTGDPEEEHFVPAWRFKGEPSAAYAAIDQVLSAYVPGHDNIDGGGFKVLQSGPAKNGGYYAYAQFESWRRGYRDDLEIAASDDGVVQVRSSSRVGFLDFAVNAKRINFIAEKLQAKGFEVNTITPKTHPLYWEQNGPY